MGKKYTLADVAAPPERKKYSLADVAIPPGDGTPKTVGDRLGGAMSVAKKVLSAGGPASPMFIPNLGMHKAADDIVANPEMALNALPVAGAITGGVLGAGAASIPLAGLGAASGEAFKQLGQRAIGSPNTPQTSGAAAKRIGVEGALGLAGEVGGLAVKPALKVGKFIAKPLAEVAGKAGSFLSGIPDREIVDLARNPSAHPLVPSFLGGGKTVKTAGKELGKATKASGIAKVIDPEPQYASAVRKAYEKATEGIPQQFLDDPKAIEAGVKRLTPQETYEAYRGVTEQMKGMARKKNKTLFRDRTIFKKALQKHLGELSGEYEKAAKTFRKAALGNQFLSPFPVTKYGRPDIMRTFLTGSVVPGLGAVAASPLVQGSVVAGISGALKGAGALLSDNVTRRAIIQTLARKFRPEIEQELKKK